MLVFSLDNEVHDLTLALRDARSQSDWDYRLGRISLAIHLGTRQVESLIDGIVTNDPQAIWQNELRTSEEFRQPSIDECHRAIAILSILAVARMIGLYDFLDATKSADDLFTYSVSLLAVLSYSRTDFERLPARTPNPIVSFLSRLGRNHVALAGNGVAVQEFAIAVCDHVLHCSETGEHVAELSDVKNRIRAGIN